MTFFRYDQMFLIVPKFELSSFSAATHAWCQAWPELSGSKPLHFKSKLPREQVLLRSRWCRCFEYYLRYRGRSEVFKSHCAIFSVVF